MAVQSHRDRPGQQATGVIGNRPLEEVVARVTIEQRGNAISIFLRGFCARPISDDHQTFLPVRHIEKGIERMRAAFLILFQMIARGIDRERRGRTDAGRKFGPDIQPLTERRDGRCDNALTETLVVDVRYIVGNEAICAACGVQVFAAKLKIVNSSLMLVRFSQSLPAIIVRLKPIRICKAVQCGPDHRLRFIALRDGNGLQPLPFLGHPGKSPHEVHGVRAL